MTGALLVGVDNVLRGTKGKDTIKWTIWEDSFNLKKKRKAKDSRLEWLQSK